MNARANTNTERRKKGFKKTIDPDDARRKREDNIIELRKAKRDESLQKKRAINLGPAAGSLEDSTRSNTAMQQKVGLIRAFLPQFQPFSEFMLRGSLGIRCTGILLLIEQDIRPCREIGHLLAKRPWK